ncbi:MAG: hypothetical protein ACI9R3_005690 [Verrucomicrobiales bacterium]|jgi:hypothetical protein
MYFKLLSSIIIAFWLVTTGLLIQMIYFPEGSQFSEVPPSQVIDSFLARGEAEDMDIFSGKRVVGALRVVPRLKDKDKETGRIRLAMKGSIDVEIGGVQGKIDLLSNLWMRRSGAVDSFSLELGMKEMGVTCEFSQKKDDDTVHYLVKRGDTVMLDSDSADASLEQQVQAQMLMRLWGIDIAKLQQQIKSEGADPEGSKMEARRGMINVEGTRLKGYTLLIKALGEGEIKFFFSEAGELLKMDSFLNYRMVNYTLRVDPKTQGTEDVKIPVPEGAIGLPGLPVPEKESQKETP